MFKGILPNGISPHDVLVYLDFKGGNTIDRFSKVLYTAANMAFGVRKNNSQVTTFNGTTSEIDCGGQIIGVGDITVCLFTVLTTHGENDNGRYMENGEFDIYASDTSDRFRVSSDGGGTVASGATNGVQDGADFFLCVTRTAAGVVNIYKDMVLNGSADQDSGTPANGTNNLIIGNNDAADRTYNGNMRLVQVYSKILTIDQMSQIFNKFKE